MCDFECGGVCLCQTDTSAFSVHVCMIPVAGFVLPPSLCHLHVQNLAEDLSLVRRASIDAANPPVQQLQHQGVPRGCVSIKSSLTQLTVSRSERRRERESWVRGSDLQGAATPPGPHYLILRNCPTFLLQHQCVPHNAMPWI